MNKRFFVALLMIVMALALVPTVGAQDDGCFGLPAEDCAAIQAGYAGLDNVTSFVQTFSIDFTATNLEALAMLAPGVPEAITFNVSGSGPLILTGEGDVPVQMAMDMVVNAAGLGEDLVAVPFALSVVDGFVYGPFGEGGELVGLPIDALTEGAGGAVGGLGLPVDPAALAGGMEGAELSNLGDLFGAGDMAAGAGLGDMSAYTSYVREGDDFVFNFDLGAFLASPEFSQVMEMAGGLAGDDQNAAMVLGMAQGLLAGVVADVAVVQSLNAEAGIVDGLSFVTNVELDLAALFGGGQEMEPVQVSVVFNVDITEINAAPAVSAPEGARQLTAEEVNALMGTATGE